LGADGQAFGSAEEGTIAIGIAALARRDQLMERIPFLELVPYIGGFGIFLIVPWIAGALARREVRASPWDQFILELHRHGFGDAAFSVLVLITFHLWAFVVPGHLCANALTVSTGRRPLHPYVINILVGLLFSTPWNPLYTFISAIRSDDPPGP
jgi:hypothetical protein